MSGFEGKIHVMTEQSLLKFSIAVTVLLALFGIGAGLFSGSSAVVFDGVYALTDAFMTVLALLVARLIAASAAPKPGGRLVERFTMGFWHLEPMVLGLNGTLLMGAAIYALINAIDSLMDGGRSIEFDYAIVVTFVSFAISLAMAWFVKRQNRRLKSAFHANLDKGYVFDPDSPEDISRLIKDEPIIEELASLVIRREFGVPSRSDNWKSKTHYICGVIWWIGNTTYQKILCSDFVGRRSLQLPKIVDLLVEGKPRKQALTRLKMRVQRVKDGIAILGLSSEDGLLYLEAAIDFNSGRLVFDPMLEHFNLDDGTIRAAERAAELNEFWAEVFLNGVCQLWDSENSRLLAEANAYLPLNCFFNAEGHNKSVEAIQAEIERRRLIAAERVN